MIGNMICDKAQMLHSTPLYGEKSQNEHTRRHWGTTSFLIYYKEVLPYWLLGPFTHHRPNVTTKQVVVWDSSQSRNQFGELDTEWESSISPALPLQSVCILQLINILINGLLKT